MYPGYLGGMGLIRFENHVTFDCRVAEEINLPENVSGHQISLTHGSVGYF